MAKPPVAALPPVEADTMPTIEVGDEVDYTERGLVTHTTDQFVWLNDGSRLMVVDVLVIRRNGVVLWPSPQEPT